MSRLVLRRPLHPTKFRLSARRFGGPALGERDGGDAEEDASGRELGGGGGGDEGRAGRGDSSEDARDSGGRARDAKQGAPAPSAGAREAENVCSGASDASGGGGNNDTSTLAAVAQASPELAPAAVPAAAPAATDSGTGTGVAADGDAAPPAAPAAVAAAPEASGLPALDNHDRAGSKEGKSKWWQWSKHPFVVACAVGISAFVGSYGVIVARTAFERWDTCPAPLNEPYLLSRPHHVKPIRSYLDGRSEGYAVVHGERGSGKSTAVWQACQHRRGVVHVEAKGTTEWEELLREHMCAWTPWNVIPLSPNTILRHAQAVRKVFGCTAPLVVITEVVRSVDRKQVGFIAKDMKAYAADKGLGTFVLVLSDAASAQEIPQDAGRQEFFWVSDFTEDEAMEYLRVRSDWSENFRERVCSEVGLRPISLSKVAQKLSDTEGKELDRALDVFVEELKRNASNNILEVVTSEPMFKGLLKAIADGRCSVKQFKDDEFGCAPKKVMRAMPSNDHVLVYDPTSHSYRFFSPAHEAEARRLITEGKW